MVKINDCVVTWSSKKQSTVALSTAESEYYGISATAKELIWTKSLVSKITMTDRHKLMATMKTDSTSAMAMTSQDNMHQRTKHIDIRHHFIRDQIKKKRIQMRWVPTHMQLADIMTKPLAKIQFERMHARIMHGSEDDQA